MKRTLLLVLVALLANAQTLERKTSFKSFLMTGRVYVPAVSTDVVARTVYVDDIGLDNTTGSSVTFQAFDKQSTPVPLTPLLTIAPHTKFVIPMNSAFAAGGITWVAGTANAIVGEIHFKE